MKLLVTAGPTREYIDPVRYISNASSGKMGYAVAQAGVEDGHDVLLISGPTALTPPPGVRTIAVETAQEMLEHSIAAFDSVDAVIMTAAVCDYRPEHRSPSKLKKEADRIVLSLVRNPDILATLGERKKRQVLVGFALEVQDPMENALDKLRRKNLDVIVLNSPENLGQDIGRVEIIERDGTHRLVGPASKLEIAREIVRLAAGRVRMAL